MHFQPKQRSPRMLAPLVLVGGPALLLPACQRPSSDAVLAKVEPALAPLQARDAVMADDPAIWVHPTDPARSLLFVSDKERGISVFDLTGHELQHVEFGTALNNIDVRHGFRYGSDDIDVLAGNLRDAGKLALLRIEPNAVLGHVLTLLSDQHSRGNDISADSYGFALYRRQRDGSLYVFDKAKGSAPVRQWRVDGSAAQVRTTLVRELTDVSMGVAEGFVADDLLGYVYFAEEDRGIHKYHADPDAAVRTRLAFFGSEDGSVADREGLALYACADASGYLVLSSQGNSTFIVYERQGTNRPVHRFRAMGARGSDGLEVTAAALPGFPQGIAVIHDDPGVRYLVYDWRRIAGNALVPCTP